MLNVSISRTAYADTESWAAACRIVNTAIATALGMQARANEGALRVQQFNRLEELIQLIADEERRYPLRVIDGHVDYSQLLEAPRSEEDDSRPPQ